MDLKVLAGLDIALNPSTLVSFSRQPLDPVTRKIEACSKRFPDARSIYQHENLRETYYVPNNEDGDELAKTFGCRQLEVKGLEPGTVLNDRYEIVRRLDAGKLSAVYLANDRKLGHSPRAVEEFIGADLDLAQRKKAIADFNREMLLLASLGHPSIPMIYDYFDVEKPGRFYVVSEYISGDDLGSRMQSAARGRIDEKMVTEWTIQIADALDYLHTQPQPIIYQNLKPKKVMINDQKNRVMLIN